MFYWITTYYIFSYYPSASMTITLRPFPLSFLRSSFLCLIWFCLFVPSGHLFLVFFFPSPPCPFPLYVHSCPFHFSFLFPSPLFFFVFSYLFLPFLFPPLPSSFPFFFSLFPSLSIPPRQSNSPAIQYGDVQYGQKPHTGNFVTDQANPASSYLQQPGPSSQVEKRIDGNDWLGWEMKE